MRVGEGSRQPPPYTGGSCPAYGIRYGAGRSRVCSFTLSSDAPRSCFTALPLSRHLIASLAAFAATRTGIWVVGGTTPNLGYRRAGTNTQCPSNGRHTCNYVDAGRCALARWLASGAFRRGRDDGNPTTLRRFGWYTDRPLPIGTLYLLLCKIM